ncbi:MAG: hypothetical protein NUW01_19320, partial [Gemmatimonadaceae bacterium]|nr:hypothetical protein [Gemmatimonadaceae bacterium]
AVGVGLLVALMVVLALSSIVIGGLMSVLVRQQRFYRGTADLIETRSQIRQAAGIIPSDLRGVSTIGGDILEITDTSMTFRATIGQAVACVLPPNLAANTIVVPPLVLANGNTLASFSMTPQAGDTVFVYDDGLLDAASDDAWRAYGITAAPGTSNLDCLALTGGDVSSRYSFALDGALSATIQVGAPMRFVRRTQYILYKAADGSWYLGYCAPACGGAPQPIAGPFLPAGGGTAGVSFSYQDAAGAATALPAAVVQISIVVRGQTQGVVDMGGYKNTYVGDSLRFSVAIRNRQ